MRQTGFVTGAHAATLLPSPALALLLDQLGQILAVVLVELVETLGDADILLQPVHGVQNTVAVIMRRIKN